MSELACFTHGRLGCNSASLQDKAPRLPGKLIAFERRCTAVVFSVQGGPSGTQLIGLTHSPQQHIPPPYREAMLDNGVPSDAGSSLVICVLGDRFSCSLVCSTLRGSLHIWTNFRLNYRYSEPAADAELRCAQ